MPKDLPEMQRGILLREACSLVYLFFLPFFLFFFVCLEELTTPLQVLRDTRPQHC